MKRVKYLAAAAGLAPAAVGLAVAARLRPGRPTMPLPAVPGSLLAEGAAIMPASAIRKKSVMRLGKGAALAVALTVAAALLGTARSQNALAAAACSIDNVNDHCYAIYALNSRGNNGSVGTLRYHCLHSGDGNNFATTEFWVGMGSTNQWWIEDGIISGDGLPDHSWFWADSRPHWGFSFHATGGRLASVDTDYGAEISYDGDSSRTWTVYGGNSYYILGHSTDQPNNTPTGTSEAGSEYTSSNIRDVGQVSSLGYLDSAGNLHGWGSSVFDDDQGPGSFINSHWDTPSSTVSWRGPC